MASFLGELRSLSSRAVDDEEADNQPKYEIFLLNNDKSVQSNIKCIIFSVGEIASIFAKSHFLCDDSKLVSSIKYSCENYENESTLYTGALKNKNAKDVIAVSLFSSTADVLVAEVSQSIPDEICYEVCEIIFRTFSPSDVLILTSKHMATFKSEAVFSHDMPFLKSLRSSQHIATHACNVPRLATPNFLSSFPASLLLKCELESISALCIINYVERDLVDSLSVQVFNDILKESIVSKITVNPNAEQRVIKYVKAAQSVESNLYL